MPRPAHRPSTAPRPTVWLDPPPVWLRPVPRRLIAPGADPEALLAFLRDHLGVYARPTLLELEAERARRGFRGKALQAAPAPQHGRMVLPMPATASLARETAAANRARIRAAFEGFAA